MKHFLTERSINLVLRAITIALKFLLSILVIKKLSIEDYGIFGLFQSTIIIMTFIVGFDFFSFSAREMLKDAAKEFNFYFKHQLLFYFFCYLIVLPLAYYIFKIGFIDFEYIILFYLITISEHLSQEIYRVLIILKKTVSATIVLFIRSGIWIALLYLFWEFQSVKPKMESLFIFWSIGSALSVLFGFKYINFKWVKGVDVDWIKKGVKIAFPFFVGTILYKVIEFSGRYFLEYYFSTKEVGIFTFFSSIANILFVFVQTIVIIEQYPRLIESKNSENGKFIIMLKLFKKQTLQFTTIGLVLSILFIYPLLMYLDKTILFDNILSYIILLFSTMLYCFSYITHYALYTYKRDIDILKATILGFIFNIVFSFILIPIYGVLGAAIAQFIAFFIMFIIKYYYWRKYKLKI